MSNLSDLLPTGGGQNAVDFVASGTLSSGQTVVLNSDGTVSAVASSPEALGSAVAFETGGVVTALNSVYDSANQKLVLAYRDGNAGGRMKARVGTVSGTSISFGAEVDTIKDVYTYDSISLAYDSINEKVVLSFINSGSVGQAIVGTVSGTSISFGSVAQFEDGTTRDVVSTFDPVSGKVIVAYRDDGNSNYLQARVGTVSGTSISFGTVVVVASVNNLYKSIAYNPVHNKLVLVYTSFASSPYRGYAIVGTVSGTTTSWGTPSAITSNDGSHLSVSVNPNSGWCFIAYRDAGNSNYGTAVIGTISGTSISFGSPVVYASAAVLYNWAVYNEVAQKIVLGYISTSNYGYLITASVSGTSITFDAPVTLISNAIFYLKQSYITGSVGSVFSYSYGEDIANGYSQVFQSASTNNTSFIGITAEAIADTATGPVNVYGGINEAQSGLTIAADYYVQTDGSISTTVSDVKIGQAISATTINMMDLT